MKLSHSLKFRFSLLFVVFIALLCAVISFVSINSSINMASEIFANQGITIIKKASAYIDGDSFEALLKNPDMEDPYYVETQAVLLNLKDNSSAFYLYTMAPVRGDIYMFVIDGSAPVGESDEFSYLGDEDDVSSYDEAFARCWETRAIAAAKPAHQADWGWIASIYAPIITSSGDMVGIIGCDFDAEQFIYDTRMAVVRQILLGAVFLIMGLVIMLVFTRMIFRPLKGIDSILREIASGEGDLTRRIDIARKDEIGELAGCFNVTMDKIMNMVIAIKGQTLNLFDIGNELAANMDQTAVSVKQITSNIQDIRGKTVNQSASVTETDAIMTRVTFNIEKLNVSVEEQTSSVSQSSSAIEEMLASIGSVTQTLIRNSENVNELTAAAEEGRQGLRVVSQDIQEISKESEGLLQINSLMQTIASQTNLLSMNAAIEAAHAGEAGKGFAVVADEIRKLAENSSNQSKTISAVLKKIKSHIDLITKSTNAVLDKFQAINDQIQTVSDQEAQVRASMEEQGIGSQQILEAIGKLNELTDKVKKHSAEMLDGSREVIEESKTLAAVTREISESMNEMDAGTGEINTAVSRVNEISAANKDHINALAVEISRFKVE
ncbi:MAG: methyl-accepting chemotaxis protein [Treponema sp.]|jgi:methyl-accepting chemotaxis protein|nr:methyl-accepting chemotaxis protein [Treponema sp.]